MSNHRHAILAIHEAFEKDSFSATLVVVQRGWPVDTKNPIHFGGLNPASLAALRRFAAAWCDDVSEDRIPYEPPGTPSYGGTAST